MPNFMQTEVRQTTLNCYEVLAPYSLGLDLILLEKMSLFHWCPNLKHDMTKEIEILAIIKDTIRAYFY